MLLGRKAFAPKYTSCRNPAEASPKSGLASAVGTDSHMPIGLQSEQMIQAQASVLTRHIGFGAWALMFGEHVFSRSSSWSLQQAFRVTARFPVRLLAPSHNRHEVELTFEMSIINATQHQLAIFFIAQEKASLPRQ